MKKITFLLFIAFAIGLNAQCQSEAGDCEAATNLKIINNGDRFSLSWDGPENAVNYQLYWQKTPFLPFYNYPYAEMTETYIDSLPYRGMYDNGYYIVAQCDNGTESISDTVHAPGNVALDFPMVDCHGNSFNFYDILDRGQYVFIDCFFWHCDGCRVIMPYIEEAYKYYGCNTGDVFFMEITPEDHDDVCLLWEEEFGVEYPTIGKDGGSQRFTWMYGINSFPNFVIIAPDHTIAYSWALDHFMVESFQSIKDAFDLFGIREQLCNIGVSEETAQEMVLYPNPTEGFININANGIVRIYNAVGQLMGSFVAENEQIMIDTNGYPEGLYIVQVDGKNHGRFVVKR